MNVLSEEILKFNNSGIINMLRSETDRLHKNTYFNFEVVQNKLVVDN